MSDVNTERARRGNGPAAMSPAVKGILVGLGVLAALLVVLYVMTAVRSGDTAPPRTSVEGVDISGLTPDAAAAAVTAQYGPVARKRLKVVLDGKTYVVKPAQSGVVLDAAASVEPAFGRSWNPVTLVGHLLGQTSLPVVVSVDRAALDTQVQSIADAVNQPPENPTLVITGGQPKLTDGQVGRELDNAVMAEALVAAVLKPRSPLPATVTEVQPGISADAAKQAADLAAAAVAEPVTVRAGTVTATIPPSDIARALSFTSEGTGFTPVLDGAVLHDAIKKELMPIETKGNDATFKIKKGKPVVVPSVVGKGISDEELATAVQGVLDKPAGQRSVNVSVGVREPKLTTEQANALGIKEKISSFTQHFPYAAYRVQNIGQAAKRINGTILMPGDTFSMNDTIKERTEANGYTKGFVVGEGGIFDEQLGGGVSTATTTMWTAAFFAGMERVKTVAHSIYISRYQAGLEATVAWGIFDMKFKNTNPYPVLITTAMTNGSMKATFWGTKEYDKIEAESSKRRHNIPFDTVYDSSDKCLGQEGVDGFWITVDRVFYKGGVEVKREPITTHYKPAPKVICGKKPGSSSADSSKPSDKPSGSSSASSSSQPSTKPSSKPSTKPGKPKPSSKPSANPAPIPPSDTFSN
jgi:vancomycin resistance protein YoaR